MEIIEEFAKRKESLGMLAAWNDKMNTNIIETLKGLQELVDAKWPKSKRKELQSS